MNNIQGWINLYKPQDITSFHVIKKIKNKFNIKKIGHAGTLDPLAEGILPIAVGKATKLISYINNDLKIYQFSIKWGTETSTDDRAGKILFKSKHKPTLKDINFKLENYLGIIQQVPPRYSAIKINGERAYKLARMQKNFEIKPKHVFVKHLKILDHNCFETNFKIECGKGFYIRSFGRDLARELGTYGHISSLKRLKVGKFCEDSSILLDDLLKISERQSKINFIQPSISMLDDILAYEIDKKQDLLNLSQGKSIFIDESVLSRFPSSNLGKDKMFLSHNGDVVSIGKLIGNLFKPNKILI